MTQPRDTGPIVCGHTVSLYSKILGEERTLLVHLPENDNDPGKRHPLLIQLDGEQGPFLHTCAAVWRLAHMDASIPDHIVVGLVNTDRSRDMSAEREADRFLRFIGDELVPFVEATYGAEGFRLLCGQSASSLFVCYALLVRPDLFDGYILNSFGFSDKGLQLYTEQFLDRSRLDVARDRYAFITNADPDPYDPGGARTQNGLRLLDRIEQSASGKVHVCYRTYAGAGHAPYPGEHDGLKWIYATKRCMDV
ncbi:MAG: hypothetical protein JXA89_02635 [Anaerolineae bacterium]|nr:hypothetical protein [Anaerolineae bacterium]